jgi:hypothetical protein
MPDPFEFIRRQRLHQINAEPGNRESLEAEYGQVWDPWQLENEFVVLQFTAPYVVVCRTADGARGSLEFQHHPRYYFNLVTEGATPKG